ncbi:MAG: peroxide stress protein YaaA [Candidatus Heimdallarchaeaceae archaeon]
MKKSKILIITICSNGKNKGGEREYKEDLSIFSLMPSQRKKILERRAKALELLKTNESVREGMPIKDLPYNQDLAKGPDFGGSASSRYMPAYERYNGRFYREIQKDVSKGKILLRDTKHHVLIISGLYGLVTAEEKIQLYSCNLPDNKKIEALWKRGDFLTSIVVAYIRKFNVSRVFDLTGQKMYRELVNWKRVKKKSEVLHAFGEQNAGPAVLPSLGVFARESLLSRPEEELLNISTQDTFRNGIEEIKLFDTAEPPEGYPKEKVEEVSFKEELERKTKKPVLEKASKEAKRPNISDHPRDIRVTSRMHNTIFNKKINEKKDLPVEVQSIIAYSGQSTHPFRRESPN